MKNMYWIIISFFVSVVAVLSVSGGLSAFEYASLNCALLVGLIVAVFVFMGVVINKLDCIASLMKSEKTKSNADSVGEEELQ